MAPGIFVDEPVLDEPSSKEHETPKLRKMFRDTDTLELHSSGGLIDKDSLGWLRPTTKDTPLEEMRARYVRDGYLWVKDVLPKEDVRKMRETYFEYLPGLTKEGTPKREGIFCGDDWRLWMQPGKLRRKFGFQDKNTEYIQRMIDAHSEKWYRDFCGHPDLKAFIRHFTGWEDTTLLERSILRPNVPGGETTQVHYDQIFLRAGPPTSMTAWVPIGDCAATGGGLIYLEDSVTVGQQLERDFNKAAENLSDAERISAFNSTMMDTGYLEKDSGKFGKAWNRKWLCANYEAGDIVLHNPFMIHSAAINEDHLGRIRLATDLRYVETGKPYDTRWMKTWVPGDGL
ncbi:uncharacterized protein PAC_02308 [Phialocephala subalpina]|uniref:Phytanoyl-CoA dioxygenase n=1 Tax=Phialocephala subalpina TaxID=576137 RepID=A0A1L7WI50_9HELO|nr:uncharacterized protein PAC_02308 [Phialocephala subalpina]